MKVEQLLCRLEILKKAATRKKLRISHLDILLLYESMEEYVVLMDEATLSFTRIPTKISLSPSVSFYKARKAMLKDLGELYK